jgi:hypothetical protein
MVLVPAPSRWRRSTAIVIGLLSGALVVVALLATIAVLAVHASPKPGIITKGEVESEVRATAARRVKGVRLVKCHETTADHWACQVQLTRRIVTAHATWTPAGKVLGIEMNLSK